MGLIGGSVLSFFLAFVVWKLLKRWNAPPSPFSHIPGPEKAHWLKGNYHQIFDRDGWQFNTDVAETYGGAAKIHGILGGEQLYVSDPLALHHIVVKEKEVYEETPMFIQGNKIIFGEGLLATLGDQHKKQRKMLNPVFSLANMRDLLPVIQPIAGELRDAILSRLGSGPTEVNIMDWVSRAALEYICQAGLGYSFSSLDPNSTNEYAGAVKMLSPTAFKIVLFRPLVPLVLRLFSPYWANKLVDWSPISALREMRRIVNVMHRTGLGIYEEKIGRRDAQSKSAGINIGSRGKGKDLMSALLKANQAAEEHERLTEAELLGQMNTFIFAAFETTSAALCRTLDVLARRPEVQTHLRAEIRGAAEDGFLPYDALMNLPYLDAVCRETLRLYPPVILLSRMARANSTLPLQYPMTSKSGAPISSIQVPNGAIIIMSIYASNRNKKIWGEDAEEWKPERWLGRPVSEVGMASDGSHYPGVYGNMMTFLGGGRACIGFKFAEMELKQVLATLLLSVHFSPAEKPIEWKMAGVQTPVVPAPQGDGITPQLPLTLRPVVEDDFKFTA